ncbi:MAG: hemerythrin hhE cation binding protein [Deltaproteobacteria bacterium]|jgi:hemerythrin superfamily protein|nr:hemerythrin hhE cation binding protein [Deltaproteobacteria bacterium]
MPNATQMIRQDHKKVEGLFKKFEQTKGSQAKRRLAENAMAELEVHAALEEEIFYPAVKNEVDDGSSMVQEAIEEHQTVKQLISELKRMEEADEEFESQFSQLMENVQHHVEEEESEMLPKVEESELDLNSLGQQMAQRKQEMQNGGRATKKASNAGSGRKSAGSKSTARKPAGKKAGSKTAARKTGSTKKSTGRKATKKSGSRSRRRA